MHSHFFGQSSFSTYAVAPAASTDVIDRDSDLRLVGPLGCGFQTGAGAVLNSLQPGSGSSIAVFGVGAVGLVAVMAAKIAGCRAIIAVGRRQSRLDLALEVGATDTVQVGEQDVVAAVQALCQGGAEFAIDTTGNPAVARQAVDALRVAGVFGLIGSAKFGTEVSLDLTHMLFGRIDIVRRSRRSASPPALTRSPHSRNGLTSSSPRPTPTATCPATSPSVRSKFVGPVQLEAEQQPSSRGPFRLSNQPSNDGRYRVCNSNGVSGVLHQ